MKASRKNMERTNEHVPNYDYQSQQREKTDIQTMFSGIAGRYDFANHFLSYGIDYY